MRIVVATRTAARQVQVFDDGDLFLLERPDRLHDEAVVGPVVVVPMLPVVRGGVLNAECDFRRLVDVALDVEAARRNNLWNSDRRKILYNQSINVPYLKQNSSHSPKPGFFS